MFETLRCPCGQRLRVKLTAEVLQVRCPACQSVIDVPPELLAEVAGPVAVAVAEVRTCPGCRRDWPKDTAVCIECGHDFRSGGKLRRRMQVREETVDMGFTGFLTTTRFTTRRDAKGKWWLVKKSRFLFFGLKPTEFALSDYTAVATDYADLGDDEHLYYLYLEGRRGPRKIWAGRSDDKMRELIDLLTKAAGLAIRRM